MTFRRICLAASIAVALSACNQKPGSQAAVNSAAFTIEVPLDGSSNRPEPFGLGQQFGGEFPAPNASLVNVDAFEVQIGNYGSSSQGVVKVRLCQGNCSEGKADLSGSKDNDYFMIALSAPLQLKPGVPVTYTLTRESGQNQLVVWSYPAKDSATRLSLPGQKADARTLKMRLRYE